MQPFLQAFISDRDSEPVTFAGKQPDTIHPGSGVVISRRVQPTVPTRTSHFVQTRRERTDPLILAVLQLNVLMLTLVPSFFIGEMISRLLARVRGIVASGA